MRLGEPKPATRYVILAVPADDCARRCPPHRVMSRGDDLSLISPPAPSLYRQAEPQNAGRPIPAR